MRTSRWIAVAVAGVGMLAACSKDSTGPGSLQYPALSATVQALFCVRGNLTAGDSINGTLSTSDCLFPDNSHYETFLLKVPQNRSVDILLSSATFDTYLALLRINAVYADSLDLALITADDDGGTGTNSLIGATALSAASDYLVIVNGYDSTDVGPYNLVVR